MKVIAKVGGSLLRSGVPEELLTDLAAVSRNQQVVIVHGGGDTVTEVAEKLGKPQRFVVSPEGIRSRYTDAETAEIYTMVMTGLLAKRLVGSLQRAGLDAVSVSGIDGNLLLAKKKGRLTVVDERGRKMLIDAGSTGKVESVNRGLLELLMNAGYLPVVSPVAVGEAGEPLNVDGDRAAAAIAASIKADAVVFLTNVDGLQLGGSLVERLTAEEASARLPEVGYGMQRKVMAAVEAVRGGAREAVICSGRSNKPLTSGLSHSHCTVVTRD